MARQIIWTEDIINRFVKLACLSKEEENIVRTRAEGMTLCQQGLALHLSPDTISKKIAILKKKYDVAQKLDPEHLPKRVKNAKELYN